MLRLALIATLTYAAYAAVVHAFQRDLLFAGKRRGAKPAPAALEPGTERVWLGRRDAQVEALYLPLPSHTAQPAPALLFAHGNAELIDDWPDLLAGVRSLGMSVLLVEYPGYGRSDGEPSEASIREAMKAGYDWLAARPEVDRERIVGYGRSLGGGAVCALVGERPLAALVLSSTFTGVRPFAASMGLPSALVRDPFDNLTAVRRFEGPVLVVHGSRDRTIPYAHGLELASAARRARFVTYDSDHNDCPSDWPRFNAEIGAFLREHGLLPAAGAASR